MNLTHRRDAGVLSMHIDGDLTIYEAAEARTQLLGLLSELDGLEAAELDLADVGELDSAGAQILLASAATLRARQLPLRLVRPSHAVTEVLGLLGLAGQFPLSSGA